MDYQAILDLVAPLDALVVQHRVLANFIQNFIPVLVGWACMKKYGSQLAQKKGEESFLVDQAKGEWDKWKKYRK